MPALTTLFEPTADPRFPAFVAPLTPVGLTIKRGTNSASSASKRILIVRTIANGDILMSTPLVASLRAALPDAHLTYLVERRERDAIEANPHIDRVLLWDTAYWKSMTRRGNYPLWWLRTRVLKRLLRAEKFDTLISLMPEDWPWLVDAVGAARTIGVFDTFREYHRQTATSRRARLYTDTFTFADLPPHRSEQYLLPLRALGITPLADRRMWMGYTEDDAAAADQFIREHALGERFAIVAPRAGWPSRCWPEDRWAAFATSLASRHNCHVLLVGGAGDRGALESVAAQMTGDSPPPVVAAGAFGFRVLAALTARALLAASGDTGPMHVAAAVGTPYVALFGPSPVERFAPLAATGRALMRPVPCGPCHQRKCPLAGTPEEQQCLRLIGVEEALEAAGGLIDGFATQRLR